MKNTTDICFVVVYAVLLFAYSSVDVFEAEQGKYCLVFWDAEFTEGVGFQAILSIDPSSLNARSFIIKVIHKGISFQAIWNRLQNNTLMLQSPIELPNHNNQENIWIKIWYPAITETVADKFPHNTSFFNLKFSTIPFNTTKHTCPPNMTLVAVIMKPNQKIQLGDTIGDCQHSNRTLQK